MADLRRTPGRWREGITPGGGVLALQQHVDRADEFQRRHPQASVPIAILRKFGEDQSAGMATMIAFWAVFSIFPLFLVFATLLGFFLPAADRASVLDKVAAMFPLLDLSTVHALSGEWWPLAVGLVSALWGGLSVVRVTQTAFNSVWEIPFRERSKLVSQVLRSLAVLATIGLGLVLSVVVTGYVAGAANGVNLGWAGRAGGYVLAIALDVGLFIAAFRVLTDRRTTTREVLPGALLSGVSFWVLQSLSSLIISRYLHNAQGSYGNFATVITILWWFYLQSMITLLGAQVNVVLAERLYPRSLSTKAGAGVTDADRRAYRAYARERAYHPRERVEADVRADDARRDARRGGGS